MLELTQPPLLLSMLIAAGLVLATVLIHYETLRLLSGWLPRLALPPRLRLVVVICGAFIGHTVEIWLYAAAYYVCVEWFAIGGFGGEFNHQFTDYLYFSTVSYTSLGLGDVYPIGPMRLLTGIQALIGLLMIGWTASFTYVVMEKFWQLHTRRNRHKR